MARGKGTNASKIFVWIILILIMVGLVGFGATGLSGTVRSIGKVGDVDIDVNRYARELEQELRAFQAQTGQPMTLAQAQAFGIDQGVLQRLVRTAAVENEAKRIGLSVGDEEVRRQVVATQAFAGANGSFDRDSYEFALDRAGLTPAVFEASVRADTARSLLQIAVSNGVNAPGAYADTLVEFTGERRSFAWIELTADLLETPVGVPSDADIQAHYDDNIAAFTLPETRELTYVWLSPDAIIDQIELDEADLQTVYDERWDEFNIPERRLLERLIFDSDESALAALQAIIDGTSTFEQQVTARGLNLADIDLGDVAEADLDDGGPEVFALTEPGIVGPIETDLGPALIRVNAILAAQETSFDAARDQLRDELAADRARRNVADQIDDVDDLLAGGATLAELAQETDMVLGKIGWVQGNDEGIAAYEEFANAAAQATTEDFPEVLTLDDGGIFALQLDAIVPPRPEPLDEARARVIASWQVQETTRRLMEQAQVLTAELNAGARLGSLGYPSTVETNITRSDFIQRAVPTLITEVFALEPGGSVIVDNEGGVIIAQLAAVLPADTEDPETKRLADAINEGIAQGIAQDTLAAFSQAMERQAGISINQSALNAVHAQFP